MQHSSAEKYDVGIVGVGVGANYGSVLTYYSLYKTIEGFGNKVLMVSKIGASDNDPEIKNNHAMKFAYANYNLSKIYSQKTVHELNDLVDTFVIGSDQVWNYGISQHFAKAFYLDFATDAKRKLSYAASFGHAKDMAPSEEVPVISALMNRFNAISVREDSGVSIARDVYQVPATQVIEPIFLTDADHYRKMAEASERDVSEPYLLAYILDPTPEKKAAIEHLAQRLGLRIRIILDAWPHLIEENKRKMNIDGAVEEGLETADFLKLYANCSYVLTDSFHGTSFALKFDKPFAAIGNRRRGVARFDSMFRMIGNKHRFTMSAEEIIAREQDFLSPMDYAPIRATLDKWVNDSKQWLKAGLKTPIADTIARRAEKAGAVARSPKHRVMMGLKKIRELARGLNHGLTGKTLRLKAPTFGANTKLWKIEPQQGMTRLRVAGAEAIKRGNLVWTELPAPLPKGVACEFTIDWTLRSTAPAINVNLRNPKDGKYKVAGRIVVGAQKNVPRVDRLNFIVPEDGYSQIMFGALQFGGPNGGADVREISIKYMNGESSGQGWKASLKSRLEKKEAGKSLIKYVKNNTTLAPLAIPDGIRSRDKIIIDAIADPKAKAWGTLISKEIPGLNFYAGREIKEYMNNKVGGPADILAFPSTSDQLVELIKISAKNDIPVTILGRGSNVIVRDGGIRGVVIVTTQMKFFSMDGDEFTSGAGSSLIEAAYYLLDRDRSALEWAAGIPGTVGGAVYMNAGTYTSDVRSNIVSVRVVDLDGNVFSLKKDDIDWGVRYTTFQKRKDWVILDATFKTTPGKKADMAKRMIGTVQSRENNMPLEYPNHGSTFKWYRAPRLIEQAGLVGTSFGGVRISEKQPGFFVNFNQATASDYEALISYTMAKVYEFSGFMLEPEVEIIGDFPHKYKRY